MTTTKERMQILKMIEEGKITAADGAELLRALEHSQAKMAEPLKGPSPPRWLRVRVTDTNNGRAKVNVNIPIGLVNIAVKMGARFVPEDIEDFDLDEVIASVRSGVQGKVIDHIYEADSERIEVFVE